MIEVVVHVVVEDGIFNFLCGDKDTPSKDPFKDTTPFDHCCDFPKGCAAPPLIIVNF